MSHADTLSALRKGRADEQTRECLEALAVSLHADDPVCVILDRAIRELEDLEESLRAVAEMRADDLDNRRLQYQDRGEYDNQTQRVPTWAIEARG